MKPSDQPLTRTGGQLLVDALKVHGVDMAFGVPGESYLSVLDAFYESRDDIKFVICRQVGGAASAPDPRDLVPRDGGDAPVRRKGHAVGSASCSSSVVRQAAPSAFQIFAVLS